jgi:hypothetical protein
MLKFVYIVPGMEVSSLFRNRPGYTLIDHPSDADIVVFTGGADINPEIYGEPVHPTTYYDFMRDEREINVYKSLSKDQFKLGICRGAQLLTALNGGKLWQDVDRHAGRHHIMMYYNEQGITETVMINSVHHQMMKPDGMGQPYEVWGVAQEATHRDMGTDKRRPVDHDREGLDPEIVWYPKDNSLCVQAHPEWHQGTADITFRCIDRAMR